MGEKKKVDDGGPAFPLTHMNTDLGGNIISREIYFGMTLRQYLCGQALAGLVSDPRVLVAASKDISGLSKTCVVFADEVIKAEKESR